MKSKIGIGILVLFILIFIGSSMLEEEDIKLEPTENISVKALVNGIEVNWTPVNNANCYYVYRSVEWNDVYYYWGVTENNTMFDETIETNGNYCYIIYPAIKSGGIYYRSDAKTVSEYVLYSP